MRSVYLFLLSIIIIIACDKGLSPDLGEEKAGFSGTITFSGEWNPAINETHIVVFKDPLLSIDDFNVFNLKFEVKQSQMVRRYINTLQMMITH